MDTCVKTTNKELEEFLRESNAIESEYSDQAYEDSLLAWDYLITISQNELDGLSLEVIKAVHYLLLYELCPDIAGKFRNCEVTVGNHEPPRHYAVQYKLKALLDFIPKTEEDIKRWHVDFENIHPFEDGNGRVGRILMNWQRVKNNLPLLIIHEGEEQGEYYKWFR